MFVLKRPSIKLQMFVFPRRHRLWGHSKIVARLHSEHNGQNCVQHFPTTCTPSWHTRQTLLRRISEGEIEDSTDESPEALNVLSRQVSLANAWRFDLRQNLLLGG